ncbi:hypothetical protein ACCAA_480006 [Candidatus Accumulibacter aalborgensis]|uniref:Uncharacterized protein n=1 Tax=Candidatus Accumulibacter aalborgensis TaxID=1860102 RepID=A0A1A8XSE4_9PROT|nr:hypothetical protein ACCAA_480006 [Candidatus Accumulibacter aalborgensis]
MRGKALGKLLRKVPSLPPDRFLKSV